MYSFDAKEATEKCIDWIIKTFKSQRSRLCSILWRTDDESKIFFCGQGKALVASAF